MIAILPPARFEKTYLSRAQSRIYGMDNPVGDPFGGAAYGEKNDPVSAVIAVVSIASGAATVATATTLAATVIGGALIAGGAMSLLGNATGNQTLMKIGGITSAVAGVAGLGLAAYNAYGAISTSMAEGAGAAAQTAGTGLETGGAMAGGADGVLVGAAPAVEVAAPTALDATSASFQGAGFGEGAAALEGGGAMSNVANTVNTASTVPTVAADAGSGFGQTAMNAGFGSGSSVVDPSVVSEFAGIDPTVATSAEASQLAGNAPQVAGQPAAQAFGSGTAGVNAGGEAAKTGGFWSSLGESSKPVSDFLKGNKELIDIGGGLIKGVSGTVLGSNVEDAKVDYMNAETNLANAKAAEYDKARAYQEELLRRYNDSIAKSKLPTNMINPNNPILQPRQYSFNGAGIINNARG